MITDMMEMMEPFMHMFKATSDMEKFHNLTDSYVFESIKYLEMSCGESIGADHYDKINNILRIWNDLNERKLYKFVGSIVSEMDQNITIDKICEIDPSINPNEIIFHKSKIGFVSGKKSNPFDELYFYNNKNPDVCHKITKEKVTFLISDTYQEYIYMFFVKDPDNQELQDKLKNIFATFDL